ncbi:MAG: hypothetical protein UR90_C0018G0003 [Parcubacteria group bacterium GW2011_GWC1_35_8]|uniref:DUF2914 domain-containing protein n=2 Tax=Candidatus Nomuraibacteriota TaxID=1752729 RepID=A0A1F6YWS6_9BACT|nr:MAG: hypothetical protein UR90_C0018G0003 [Parcubacteria group bacterium GW2011_GWC1_35_8]KKP88861.1 MAG: hypothetical protein UR91_C0011G0021 [Candidatus Nomurabacteria bacterium GW2011_GWC2_35_8]OGJ06159.1 MAG: hypothetical protein A2238_02345 [Candidatus Nomurabacteria bacterium RIFOXYA2_FULL_35_9]OGJ10720.1 MAG: hypothetical protein A2456_02710 [Candidatus Nomurabacteria bacterium RIFOXYC2_FULL_36_19]OGJ13913.1 MAG: hypothetical protein A2554_02755 [Candidatus Nomurabacteria bacterium RI
MFFIEPIRNFYGRFERPISSLSLILGFVFDAFTLRRVDTLFENVWILGHLIILGIFIILIHIKENEAGSEGNPKKAHFWYVNILQFFFGGTLSAYLVFYFRSSDIFTTWPFIALLVIAFIANESLKRHYIRLSFQISLFFLSIYSFMIFLVPIIFRQISVWMFLLAGLFSLIFIFVFIKILIYLIKDKYFQSRRLIILLISGIFTLINALYFTNLIPPIPLSLKDAGAYHSIQKNAEGNYDVTYENQGWRGYFKLYPDFKETLGKPIYAFSAIFSPKDINLNIVHEWQHYNEASRKWTTESLINLSVNGGRGGGFRTYSMRTNLTTGKWRVNIKTEQNQTIGILRFNVILTDTDLVLTRMIK